MLDIIFIFIHFYCLCLFVRIVFPEREELFFHPALRVIRDLTDPPLLFLKNNSVMKSQTHPLLPLILLLLLKAIIYQSGISGTVSLNITSVLIVLFQFLSFLFKIYLLIFWIIFSSDRYNFFDDFFNILSSFFNKTLLMIPFPGNKKSLRNDPVQSILLISLFFLLSLIVINLSLFFITSESSPNILPVLQNIFFSSLKLVLSDLLELLAYFPFLLFIRILISWFMPPMTKALMLLHTITEPLLEPFRRLNLTAGMIDFSPIIAFFVLQLLINFLQYFINLLP